jgi:predicted AAA+ superfamily ATPase
MEAIDQSLAGRVAVLNLLPFSAEELRAAGALPSSLNKWLYTGAYPRIYDRGIDPADYYPSYIQTYLERDVRQATRITMLAQFERMLSLCAARTSEALNMQALSRDVGVAVNTVREWLSVLEASYLVSRLQPYSGNLGRRLTKTPKLYVGDTGLACSLVGIESPEDLDVSPLRGPLMETVVIEEIRKAYLARGRRPKLFFYRDAAKREIDILVERGVSLAWGIEVKASSTYSPRFFKHLDALGDELGLPRERRVVVYAGKERFETLHGLLCALQDLPMLGI